MGEGAWLRGRARHLAFLTAAAATLVLGALTGDALVDDLSLRDRGVRVEAAVVEGSIRAATQRPRIITIDDTDVVVRFDTRDNRQIETHLQTTRRDIGPTVALLYDPDNPRRTRAVHGPHLPWRWPLLWFAVVLTMTVLLGADLLRRRAHHG